MPDITYVPLTVAQQKAMDKAWAIGEKNERESFLRLITDTAKDKRYFANILWTYYKVRIGDPNANMFGTEFSAICKAFGFTNATGESYRGRSAMALQEDYVCLRGEAFMNQALSNFKADPKNDGKDCKNLQKLVPYLTAIIKTHKVGYDATKPAKGSGSSVSDTVKERKELRIAVGKFGMHGAFQDKPGRNAGWKATTPQTTAIEKLLSQCGLDIAKLRNMTAKDIRLIGVMVDEAAKAVEANNGPFPMPKPSNVSDIGTKVNAKGKAKSA
jgi:hypothetical protein